jgi:hypothetical protein
MFSMFNAASSAYLASFNAKLSVCSVVVCPVQYVQYISINAELSVPYVQYCVFSMLSMPDLVQC